ncbi:Mannose-6-phosphate isomerase [Pseudonocardia sp. Ae168_Ps1]|uniref:mannose-6-phosphate isomerase, class I n=1 Tax=unclassified Pseudonocardia TaxID=2619320 RepID=UPI00094B588D|nr:MULTISPECIES: mannose-6-phosphate isomerase, class I [unclassified Pseudonocardia]OLL73944.1 Mannose-6-phosphate isomerase [Pseudonocardia sp. Ae150A_Ps1]OLL79922.1 Mannose-6-phosphate isomerase [Pseudonocardia sp. Ae168_Ps1]OLL85944.1 Mannose-6-phosphate isomerase [Pseudonocardia sp. Ae263_Ps1]OLL94025.1 Mannose-6-phosphate isomerase [Pseudonocardia sp. Ae356_Ps1]
MELLENPIRTYAWGSRTVIAELLGQPVPAPHPQAELWLGAHPAAPSKVRSGDAVRPLHELIAADPAAALGPGRDRWEGRLPFLLKLLAADEPLSLQAHPSLEQARDGWARENAAGLPVDAPDRNYRDANHKPELICALTDFVALVGFREPASTVALLRALDVPELASYAELLAGQPNPDGLRALFTTWITLPQSLLDELVLALQGGAVRLLERGAGEWTGEAKTVLDLSERYPGDVGVLAALLLNRTTLAPGEALYLPAGNLHAYLSGAGIELMANSDNVLRGGLTPKHVDVPELLRVLDFAAPPPAVRRPAPEQDADGWHRYDVPVEEFRLRRADTGGRDKLDVPGTGARIMLCTSGDAAVEAGGAEIELPRGAAVYLSAGDTGAVLTTGDDGATVFLAGDAL